MTPVVDSTQRQIAPLRRIVAAAAVVPCFRKGVALLLLATVLILAGRPHDDGSLDRVQATGIVRVGMDASFPPFESLDSAGEVVGFDVELARRIAAQMGARPQFVNIGFDSLADALVAGRVDVVVSGLPYDERRTRDLNYSQPYFNAGQLIAVRRSDAGSPDPDPDVSVLLANRRVAVEWGSMGDLEARRLQAILPGLSVRPHPGARAALHALAAGQADAAIADAISVYQFMASTDNSIRAVAPLTEEPYVIATRLRSRLLANAIDAALSDLRQSGSLDDLFDGWLGKRR